MNIAKAFIERNRLKQFISEKSLLLQGTKIFHREDEKRSWRETNGSTYTELANIVIEGKKHLAELCSAIDDANYKSGARNSLNKIEGLKAIKETYEGIIQRARNVQDHEIVVSNGATVAELENILDVDLDTISDSLKEVKKEIRKLEDELSTINLTTQVELGKELEDYLSSYND